MAHDSVFVSEIKSFFEDIGHHNSKFQLFVMRWLFGSQYAKPYETAPVERLNGLLRSGLLVERERRIMECFMERRELTLELRRWLERN
jgi:hypothetical protein